MSENNKHLAFAVKCVFYFICEGPEVCYYNTELWPIQPTLPPLGQIGAGSTVVEYSMAIRTCLLPRYVVKKWAPNNLTQMLKKVNVALIFMSLFQVCWVEKPLRNKAWNKFVMLFTSPIVNWTQRYLKIKVHSRTCHWVILAPACTYPSFTLYNVSTESRLLDIPRFHSVIVEPLLNQLPCKLFSSLVF